jgi:hypothetical protein
MRRNALRSIPTLSLCRIMSFAAGFVICTDNWIKRRRAQWAIATFFYGCNDTVKRSSPLAGIQFSFIDASVYSSFIVSRQRDFAVWVCRKAAYFHRTSPHITPSHRNNTYVYCDFGPKVIHCKVKLQLSAVSGGRLVCLQSKVAPCRRNEGFSYHGDVRIMKYRRQFCLGRRLRVYI